MANELYGILDDLKSNAVPFVTGGAGVLAGLVFAKNAHDFVADFIAPTTGANAKPENETSPLRLYVAPLVPVALGIATVVYGRGKVPDWAESAVEGAGLGLAAWGVGRLLSNTLPADSTVRKYLPTLAGLGRGSMADYYIRRAQQLRGLGYGRCRDAGQRGSNIQCDPKLLTARKGGNGFSAPVAEVVSITPPLMGRSRRARAA